MRERRDPFLVFYPTHVICDFFIHKLNAIEEMLVRLNQLDVNVRLEDPNILTVYSCLSVILCGLVSRPRSLSYYQNCLHFIYGHSELRSELLLCPNLFYFDKEKVCWNSQYTYEGYLTMFTPEGRKALSRKKVSTARTAKTDPQHHQFYNVPNTYYFNPIKYQALPDQASFLFTINQLEQNNIRTYNGLPASAYYLVNLMITEGLTQRVAFTLVNCFAQDVWNLISNTNAFKRNIDLGKVFTLQHLVDRHLLDEVFVSINLILLY